MDPYATHLAPLVEAALIADGPLLELGCGDYSTPVLAAIARHKGVPLMVMTAVRDWGARYAGIASVRFVDDWTRVSFPPAALVLLDNEQKTKDRIRQLPLLAETSDVVVVHDLEQCESHAHWREMTARFRAIRRHVDYSPGTGVLSC